MTACQCKTMRGLFVCTGAYWMIVQCVLGSIKVSAFVITSELFPHHQHVLRREYHPSVIPCTKLQSQRRHGGSYRTAVHASKPKKQKSDRVPYSLGARPYIKKTITPKPTHVEKEHHTHAKETNRTVDSNILSNRTVPLSFENNETVSVDNATRLVMLEHHNATTTHVDGVSKLFLAKNDTTRHRHIQNITTKTASKQRGAATSRKTSSSSNNFFNLWPYKNGGNMNWIQPKPKRPTTSRATPSPTIPSKRNQNDLVTVADLEEILRANGYVRQSDLTAPSESSLKLNPFVQEAETNKPKVVSKTSKRPSPKGGEVAFPQSTVLSYRHVKVGSTLSGGCMGLIVGVTIYPNLWLMGMLLGGAYGYDVSNKLTKQREAEPSNVIPRLVLGTGRLLAKSYLRVYDTLTGIWFMYKTGQLSYEYYKRYASIDERFHVQDKLDAWNARFQQGKIAFDKWEKENEVGRKILAGLRTAWLVQEDSFKKEQRRYGRQSPYRVVRYAYKVTGWFQKLISALWNAVTGGGSSQLQELWEGIRVSVSESKWSEQWSPRIGAAVAALVTCYCVGVMFAVAPMLLAFLAIGAGMVFPTWLPQAYDQFSNVLEETRARGRGEEKRAAASRTRSAARGGKMSKRKADKQRYHYYMRSDGTKKWYRTGQPLRWFDRTPKEPEKRGLFGLWSSERYNGRSDGRQSRGFWGS